MKKQNQTVTVMLMTAVAIFLTLGTTSLTTASMAIVFTVCIPFAIVGMISTEKQSMAAFVVSVLAIFGLTDVRYAMEVVVTFVIPSILVGRLIDSVSEKDDEERQEPIYMGIIIFILSTIAYVIIAKYMMNIDVVKQLTDTFCSNIKDARENMPKEQLNILGSVTATELTDMFRNMIVSLFYSVWNMCILYIFLRWSNS